MSFAQGAPTQPLVLQASNVFLYGSSTTGNAFTVQQQSAGNVASFVTSTGVTSLIINPSGQVGIGKTNPGYALDVTGDLNFTGTFRQNGTPYVGSQWTGTTSLYFIGNVGIGTNVPSCALSFGSTTNNKILCLWDGNTSDPVSTGYSFYGFGVNSNYLRFQVPGAGTTPSDGFYWWSSNTERMRIQAGTGNVGIGTNNPAKLLHVWGGMIIGASSDSRATTVTLNAPGATVTFSQNADIGDGARVMCLQCPDLSSTTANLVSFSLQVAPTGTFGSQRTSLDLKGFRVANQSYGGFCITSPFDTAGSYDLFYADRTKAYFQQSVGIGTASPGYKLNVDGGAIGVTGTNNYLYYAVTNSTSSGAYMMFDAATAGGSGRKYQIGSTGTANNPGTGCFEIYDATGGATRLVVNSSGNVGIGTTNPSYRHHVYNGDASVTYYGPNATWSASLMVGAGGNYSASQRAQVMCSNGNLHIDCGQGAYQIYLNYYQGGGNGGTNATVGCYAAFTATGDITAFSSDERLKTKVGSIENALDKVCSLTAFKYIHNETARQNGFTDDNVYVGLSAQEVQKVLPEVVKPAPFDEGTVYDVGKGKSKSGENYLTIQYERIVSLLVEAVKEERSERLRLQDRLERLERLLSQDRTR